jgi:hypothetical protein
MQESVIARLSCAVVDRNHVLEQVLGLLFVDQASVTHRQE